MSRDQANSTSQLLTARSSFLDLVAVAVFGALGVNVLASALMGPPTTVAYALAGTALGLIALSIGFVGFRINQQLTSKILIKGILPVDSSTNEIMGLFRYEFSEEAKRISKAAFMENAALERSWTSINKDKNGLVNREAHERFVVELVEYYILKSLSLHLSAYFDGVGDHGAISNIERENIPDVLLKNRILSHLSTPMEDRASFTSAGEEDGHLSIVSPKGEIVYSVKRSGEIFDLFRLTLPLNSHVKKGSDSSTIIITPRFTMVFEYNFSGARTNFPRLFEQLYLGREWDSCTPLIVDVSVSVRFRALSLLSGTGWHYFRWVDTFIERLERSLSFDAYVEKIGWAAAVTDHIVGQRRLRKEPTKAVKKSTDDT